MCFPRVKKNRRRVAALLVRDYPPPMSQFRAAPEGCASL